MQNWRDFLKQALATTAFTILAAASAAVAQEPGPVTTPPSDGEIVERMPCSFPFGSYEEYLAFLKERPADPRDVPLDEPLLRHSFPRDLFDRVRRGEETECFALKYWNDGLRVAGFLVQPKQRPAPRLPLIVYNRGGNLDFGRINFTQLLEFHWLAARGYVVVASQYRGNGGGEGREELGGADVRDVLHLFPLARSLGYVDLERAYMYGGSRGGMMTCLAIKHGAPVRAAATVGGVFDLEALAAARPEMVEEFRALMPDFDRRAAEHYRERSAIHWIDRLDTPLLILHGGLDWRVEPTQALALAQRLTAAKKTYQLIIYAKDDHSLTRHRMEALVAIEEWFREH